MERYYIVRGNHSGVFAGEIKCREGQEATLANVRNIWSWDGAATLLQLAAEGTKRPGDCKFTIAVEELILTDVIEMIPCTEAGEKSIKAVPEWKL